MKLPLVWAVSASLLIQGGYAQTGAPEVVNADSGWNGAKGQLVRGGRLEVNQTLTATKSGELLVQCSDLRLMSYSCRLNPCTVQACVTQKAPGLDVREVELRKAGIGFLQWDRLTSRQPRSPIFAAARAGGNPNDAVLRQEGESVHFGPALTRVLEGQYCLRIRELPVESSAPPRVVTLTWDRAVEPEGMASVPGLRPGLYTLEVGAPESGGACRVDAEQVPAWVLTAPDSSYGNVNRQWRDALPGLAELDRGGASQALLITLRHAALATLAESK